VRAVATDGLGQTGEDTLQFTLADNPNEPAVAFAGTTHGAQYITGARFNVQGSASDPVGIQSLQFFVDDPQGAPLAGTLGALAVIAGIVAGEVLTGEPRAVAVSVGASAAAVIVTTVVAGVYLGHGALVRYNITLVLPPLLSLAAIVVTTVAFGRETPGAALWAFAAGQRLDENPSQGTIAP
ncbi:MAG: hypothetical protein HUU03_07300, partial [Planctomycetaceae bacterium]|nr:hypothetical protein [Planctomycetaceae bacterium]